MGQQSEQRRRKLVVLGNGMAAGRTLEELFARAPDRYDVTIFGAEPRVNYDRIMLSPVLAGDKAFDDIIVHNDAWYAGNNIDLRRGETVVAIDRAARTIRTHSGTVEAYDDLVIATGSRPILIPVPGAELPGVVTFRDLDDVNAMLAAAGKGGNAVVIGGGFAYTLIGSGVDAGGVASGLVPGFAGTDSLLLATGIRDPLNVIVALTLYGLALLVPATADALDAVDARVLDAATAMGMGRLRCFLTVELPLAGPAILTGLLVNARLALYSTSLARHWASQPRWFKLAAAALLWLWLVEGVRPDRWDMAGVALSLVGAGVILFGPHRA